MDISRYDYLDCNETRRETLHRRNSHEVKKLTAPLPGVRLRVARKDDLIGALERFLLTVDQHGAAGVCKGTALLIECLSPEIADRIAQNAQTHKRCQRTGDRGPVVRLDKEKAFRDALNVIGYVMPRVRSMAASGCWGPWLGWCRRRARVRRRQ